MVADDDHAIAREELRAVAVRREECPMDSGKALGSMDGDALPGNELGKRIDLPFHGLGPLRFEIDEPAAGVPAAEFGFGWRLPAHRLFVEDNEVLGRRYADHNFAQSPPFVMDAGHQGALWQTMQTLLPSGSRI